MRIQIRILLGIGTSLLISSAILLAVFLVLRGMEAETARSQVFGEIKNKIDDLNLSIARFPNQPYPSRISQITEMQRSLEKLFQGLVAVNQSEEFLLRNVRANSREIRFSVKRLISGSTAVGEMSTERYNVLLSQLWMKTQFISDDTTQLLGMSQARVKAAQKKTGFLTLGLIAALIITNAAISFFFGKQIAKNQEDLQRALAKAEEGDQLLSALMDYVPEGITICDKDLNLKMVSSHGQELLGTHQNIPIEEVIESLKVYQSDGVTPMPVEDLPLVKAVHEGETTKDVELIQVNERGRKLPLLCNAAPIRDLTGKIVGGIVAWRDISERKHAEEALRAREVDLNEAQRLAHLGSWYWHAQTDITTGTDELLRIYGFDPATQTIPNFKDQRGLCYPPEEWDRLNAAVQESVLTGTGYDLEVQALRNGKCIWIQTRSEAVCNTEGRIVGLRGTVQDITERKVAEEAIRASLAEKDVMLKEIHHRVKNNLQIISSLISLQTDTLTDERIRGELNDVRDRVRSMGLVHEKLYQTRNMASLDFAEYAAGLMHALWRSHHTLAENVQIKFAVEPVSLSIEAAVPCGLILNELAGNALKHAFPNNSSGEVELGLKFDSATGIVCLRIRDNGVGLPADFDWRQTESLGLRLVKILAGQLCGTVETETGAGTEFRIIFPLNENNQ